MRGREGQPEWRTLSWSRWGDSRGLSREGVTSNPTALCPWPHLGRRLPLDLCCYQTEPSLAPVHSELHLVACAAARVQPLSSSSALPGVSVACRINVPASSLSPPTHCKIPFSTTKYFQIPEGTMVAAAFFCSSSSSLDF